MLGALLHLRHVALVHRVGAARLQLGGEHGHRRRVELLVFIQFAGKSCVVFSAAGNTLFDERHIGIEHVPIWELRLVAGRGRVSDVEVSGGLTLVVTAALHSGDGIQVLVCVTLSINVNVYARW